MSENKIITFYKQPAKLGDRYIFIIPIEIKPLINKSKVYEITIKELD